MTDNRARLLDLSKKPAPKTAHWAAGIALAAAAHALAVLPFLPEPEPEPEVVEPPSELGVSLAPVIQPPEIEAPPPPPEPVVEEEIPVIQERAADSPPPAPPETPRAIPDLPDIRPQAIPEMWRGAPGSGGGEIGLEDFLRLREWLAQARARVMEEVRYPERAAQDRISGRAKVLIIAASDGEIVRWSFMEQSGHPVLNRAVERAISRVRRLPPFPEGTTQERLAYSVEFRFELVMPDGTILSDPEDGAPVAGAEQVAAPPPRDLTPLGVVVQCASTGARLEQARVDIETARADLTARSEEYQRLAERYYRDRREPPRRVERMLDEINADTAAFNTQVEQLRAQAQTYQNSCGSIRTSYEDFARACAPYLNGGNGFCEAFGPFWGRLTSGEG